MYAFSSSSLHSFFFCRYKSYVSLVGLYYFYSGILFLIQGVVLVAVGFFGYVFVLFLG